MPVQHVATAAAVLIAASAISTPAVDASSEPAATAFVEVLLGPHSDIGKLYQVSGQDAGC